MKAGVGILLLVAGALLIWANAGEDNVRVRRESVTLAEEEKGRGEEEAAVVVVPAEVVRLRIRVIDKATRKPVAGALLGVWDGEPQFPDVTTDEYGKALLVVPKAQVPDTVWIREPGEPLQTVGNREFYDLPEGKTKFDIAIPLARTVRWLIEPGPHGVPADGTRIEVLPEFDSSPVTPPRTGVMESGWLVVSGWSPAASVAGRALAPNGTVAVLVAWDEMTMGEPTSFERARAVELELRDASGRLAPGVRIGISEANGSSALTALTDQRGVVRFGNLPCDFATLRVLHSGAVREWIGRVGMSRGDARVTYRLKRPARFELKLRADGTEIRFQRAKARGLLVESLRYDAPSATLSGIIVPVPGVPEVTLKIWAADSLHGRKPVVLPAPGGLWSGELQLTTNATLGTLLVLMEDVPDGVGWDIDLARDDGDRWATLGRLHGDTQRNLRPGTYGVRLRSTDYVFGPVTLHAGENAEIVVDGMRIDRFRCIVKGPDGKVPEDVSVFIEGEGFWGYLDIAGDEFYGFLPRGVRFRLRAEHDELAPDPVRGTFDGVGGNSTIELRLAHGPTTRFTMPAGFGRAVFVLLYRGEPREPEEWALKTKGGSFTGYSPGRYTVCFVGRRRTLIFMRDVDLGDTDVDLGEVPPQKGSTLTIRSVADEPFVGPPIHAKVTRIDAPRLTSMTRHGGRLRIPHRAAGRYSLEIRCGPMTVTRVVTLDGEQDEEVVIDLRTK